jgi:pentatricopeptide repeat protein
VDGIQIDVFVGSSLVDMYAKCGSKADAWRMFNKMPSGNVVAWIVMILVHVNFLQTMAEGTGTTLASEAGACATKFC